MILKTMPVTLRMMMMMKSLKVMLRAIMIISRQKERRKLNLKIIWTTSPTAGAL